MPCYACFTLDQVDSCPRRLGLFSRATGQAPLEEISETHSEEGREKHRKWGILNINGAKRLTRKTRNFLTAEVNKGDPDSIEIAQFKSCWLKSKTLFPSLSLFWSLLFVIFLTKHSFKD